MQQNFAFETAGQGAALPLLSETTDLFMYRFQCPLRPQVDENRNGCGWDRTEETDDAMSLLDNREALEAIRRVVAELDGQDLAQYCDDPTVKAIDVIVRDIDKAEIFVHFDKEPSLQALAAFREDLLGQLSDGFGENLEQTDLGLVVRQDAFYSSSRSDDLEWNVMFGFDYDRLGQPEAYNPDAMMSLDDIELHKNAHKLTSDRSGRPGRR